MAKRILLSLPAAAVLLSSPAYAHDGEHSVSAVVSALHWISSPSHALIGTVCGLAVLALVAVLIKKSRA